MNFKTEFIQICFCCSADFIQPSFHLFCNRLIAQYRQSTVIPVFRFTLRSYMHVRFTSRSYMLARFTSRSYMLVRFTLRIYRAYTTYIADFLDCMFFVHELKIKLLKSKLESCPVFSCSRSQYLGIVTSSFPASQASCRVSFPLVVLTPKSLEFS